jgi:hypothetical protein
MTAAQADQMGVKAERRGFYFRLGSVDSKTNYSAPEASEWFERIPVVIGNEQVVRCLPWEPPTGKLTDEQTKTVIAAIEKGTSEGPYSPQLGNTGRSLAHVLADLGLTNPKAQKQALDALVNSGAVVKARWKQPGKGKDTHAGLRSAAGLPYRWEWCGAQMMSNATPDCCPQMLPDALHSQSWEETWEKLGSQPPPPNFFSLPYREEVGSLIFAPNFSQTPGKVARKLEVRRAARKHASHTT